MINKWKRMKRQNRIISAFYKIRIYPGLYRYFFYKKRLPNFILNKFNQKMKSTRLSAMPYILIVEPVCGCNLKCPLCPVGNRSMNRKWGKMSFEVFKRTIDVLEPYTVFLYFTNWGEPLLHKDISKMIKYAKEKKIFVSLATNAYYLTKENIDKLIDSGIDAIKVSLDGASEETYTKYRKGSDFKKVVENIKRIAMEKRRFGTKKPFVNLQFIVMKHNEHEVEKIRILAKEMMVDRLSVKTVWISDKDSADKFLPRKEEYTRYKSGLRPKKKNLCKMPWESVVINYDGSISVCCMDCDVRFNMGNIDHNFKKTWNNDKYVDFRKQLKKDMKKISICKDCSSYQSLFLE